MTRIFSIVIVAALFAVSAIPVKAATFDLNSDFSAASNPNGPWTFREGVNALPAVANWTPLTSPVVQPAWAPSANSGGFLPAWFQSTSDNPGGLNVLTGDVVVHTIDNFNGSAFGTANVIWTSPTAGTVDVTGSAWMARDIGRSNSWSIALNGSVLSSGSLFSGDPFDRTNPFDFATGSGGVSALTNLAVLGGDILELSFARTFAAGDFIGVNLNVELATLSAIPVPGALLLMLSGLFGLVCFRRRRAA